MTCRHHKSHRSLWHGLGPYVFLALTAATLYGVMAGAGPHPQAWRCEGVTGPGSVGDGYVGVPAKITQTPEGWVIEASHLGVLSARECHPESYP